MTDLTSPPCDQAPAPLPPRNSRVRHVISGLEGVVVRTDAACGTVCCLWDGAMYADWYRGADVEDISDEDADREHDRDDALYDERREDALEAVRS